MKKGYLLTNGRVVYPTKEQWDIICYPISIEDALKLTFQGER